MKKLGFVLVILVGFLCISCNNYLDKPIYEPLTVEELKKALEKDLTFEYLYEYVEEPAKALKENTLLKAKFSDLTYRKMLKTLKYLNSDEYRQIYDSFEKEWKDYAVAYQPQVDSIVGYWKGYIKEMNQSVKIEPIKIRKEYYSFGSLKSVELGFRITPLKENLESVWFRFQIVSKADTEKKDWGIGESCFVYPRSKVVVEYADVGYSNRELLENQTITTFLENYDVITEVENLDVDGIEYSSSNIPFEVEMYLKSENDEDWNEWRKDDRTSDIIEKFIDKKFLKKFDYVEQKQKEFLEKKCPLYIAFKQFVKNYYEQLRDKKY